MLMVNKHGRVEVTRTPRLRDREAIGDKLAVVEDAESRLPRPLVRGVRQSTSAATQPCEALVELVPVPHDGVRSVQNDVDILEDATTRMPAKPVAPVSL